MEAKFMHKVKIAAIQMDTQRNKAENLEKARYFIEMAANEGANVISLPEYFNFIGEEHEEADNAERIPSGETTALLSHLAKKHNLYIHGGSILEKTENHGKFFNTTVVINPDGEVIETYRKIHLFDVEVENGPAMKESHTKEYGNRVVVVDTEYGRWGLSICYDLRFPELYRLLALQGAELLFVPAEFTLHTGKDHWETLLRARAIENQCFVVATAQIGRKPLFSTYGRSMIVDPWGTVLAVAPDIETIITAEVDLDRVFKIREQIPCLQNRRSDVYELKERPDHTS